MPRQTKN